MDLQWVCTCWDREELTVTEPTKKAGDTHDSAIHHDGEQPPHSRHRLTIRRLTPQSTLQRIQQRRRRNTRNWAGHIASASPDAPHPMTLWALANFGQTIFGQIQVWPNHLWPEPSSAMPTLAKFGKNQVWPNQSFLAKLTRISVLMFCRFYFPFFFCFPDRPPQGRPPQSRPPPDHPLPDRPPTNRPPPWLWGRRGFTRQIENSKRAHLRVPALQKHHQSFTRTPPREGRKKENCGWTPPPHPSGPQPSKLPLRGPPDHLPPEPAPHPTLKTKIWCWLNLVWSKLVLAKLCLVKVGCWPKMVWPKMAKHDSQTSFWPKLVRLDPLWHCHDLSTEQRAAIRGLNCQRG